MHSHTLHSRESLDFVGRATRDTPWLAGAIRKQEAAYRARKGRDLDLKRAWWTPPLSASQAWNLEKRQIETTLGLNALVSLSDHDNIEAGQHLRVLDETRDCPISVEWTAPFRQTFFHIGLHNLAPHYAAEMMRGFADFTAAGSAGSAASAQESRIAPLLDEIEPSEHVVVLHKGRVLAEGEAAEIIAQSGAPELRGAFTALTEGAGS